MESRGFIQVRPYLLRYVQWRENLAPEQSLVIPGCSPVAVALDLCLTNKTTYLASRAVPIQADKFNARLFYTVAGSRSRDGFLFVTDAMTLKFNTFVMHALHNDLADRIAQNAGKKQEKEIIWAFIAEVGMEELVEFDALKKANYRLRLNRNLPHGRGRNRTYSPTTMTTRFLPGPASLRLAASAAPQLRLAI